MNRLVGLRRFSTTKLVKEKVKDITKIPLSMPLASEVPLPSPSSKQDYNPFDTKLSTTESGIRVASEPHYGSFCTVGVAIESGSRYEFGYPLGTSHLIEKLAFGASLKHSSRDEIYGILEKQGALIDCQSTKDTFIYAASCQRSGLDALMEIIANAIWRPQIKPEEFEESKMIVMYENEDMARNIQSEPLLTDWIHAAAFKDNTLGYSKYTSNEAVEDISRQHIFTYMSQYHAPQRVVVAGVGVPHDELEASVRKHFDWSTTTWAKQPEVLLDKIPALDESVAQYTGGEVRVKKDLSKLALGTPYPHLAHVVLGFEGVGFKDPDFVPFCVLQSLLGGGGSFSAGGPGKGMYTRLYTEVMNKCHWIYSATAFNHSYADSGLFCIQSSSEPKEINNVLIVLLDLYIQLLAGVHSEELNRAKIQLKSQLMMNLEIRPVMFEDLARQVMGHGNRRKPDEYMAKIDAVTHEDIRRVVERMLSSRPSLVGYGEIESLATYSALDDAVAHRDIKRIFPTKKMFSWQ